ncbi:hypothetical protein Kfla_5659 [Kribbella flavida DSM 17836]|uniref:Uncharacterized protein n=1 Tax=Kribbella flavida (strain DSM 17836 / JCM 10339 / NBRC 14399) TaxID=479435 RepID=D2PP69_KRIFD|nr:hypothetical protein [Kribbella flavida]ADB34665.1 hypothetical protein Kfla_5659 [Kribbella flavida DSM 17836]
MQTRPRMPTWVTFLLGGVPFGVVMGAFIKQDDGSWTEAVVGGVLIGIFFGAAMVRLGVTWDRATAEAEGELPEDKLAAAYRAADGGPIPEDPEVRAAARRIALAFASFSSGRMRRFTLVMLVVLIDVTVVAAILDSPWVLVYTVFFSGVFAVLWWTPRRSRRRAEELSRAPATTSQ